MTLVATAPKKRSYRKFWIIAAVAVMLILWVMGSFDRFFAQLGLDFLIAQGCVRTLAGAVLCGDQISTWCDQFGALSENNKAICAGR
jgi:hypothetical protein